MNKKSDQTSCLRLFFIFQKNVWFSKKYVILRIKKLINKDKTT